MPWLPGQAGGYHFWMSSLPTPLPYGIPAPSYRLPDATHIGAVHL